MLPDYDVQAKHLDSLQAALDAAGFDTEQYAVLDHPLRLTVRHRHSRAWVTVTVRLVDERLMFGWEAFGDRYAAVGDIPAVVDRLGRVLDARAVR